METANQYTDPETGFKMVPGTQRPDGTWRKPIRVKDGYVPQDEVKIYESKGRAIGKSRDSNYIPGLTIDTFVIPTAPTSIPGLSSDPSPPVVASKTKKKKKGSGQNSTSSNPVPTLTAAMDSLSVSKSTTKDSTKPSQPVATDPSKKLRNLKKKLRDIEALEAKIKSGEITEPEPDQLEKVGRKADVLKEIFALEMVVN